MTSSVNSAGCGEVNRTRSRPSMRPQARSSCRESAAVARLIGVGERHPVGVDVLPEQRHLEYALVHQRLHLGQHVTGPAVDLLAAQRGHDAERAGVVAANRDGNPTGVGGFARRGQVGRKLLKRLEDFDLGRLVVPGAVEQRRQRSDVVRAEDDVHPRELGNRRRCRSPTGSPPVATARSRSPRRRRSSGTGRTPSRRRKDGRCLASRPRGRRSGGSRCRSRSASKKESPSASSPRPLRSVFEYRNRTAGGSH